MSSQYSHPFLGEKNNRTERTSYKCNKFWSMGWTKILIHPESWDLSAECVSAVHHSKKQSQKEEVVYLLYYYPQT